MAGNTTVDLAHHRVTINGQAMDNLTYKEVELLFYPSAAAVPKWFDARICSSDCGVAKTAALSMSRSCI